jgi:hypothetical protein
VDVLILGGTQFIGREIALALASAGHAVSIFNRGTSPDDLPAGVERLRGDRDQGIAGLTSLAGPFNLAGPRITWAEWVPMLGVNDPVWVPVDRLRAAGLTESQLPLFRTDLESGSSKMHVGNEKARSAGLVVTDPQTTARDTQAWLADRDFVAVLSPAIEAEIIGAVPASG